MGQPGGNISLAAGRGGGYIECFEWGHPTLLVLAMEWSREALQEMIKSQAADEGLVLVDLKLARHRKSNMLRVFVDKPGGINLGECARFSRRLELLLDRDQAFDGNYTLEVSSPGLDRPLKTLEDFSLKIGERLQLFMVDEGSGQAQLEGTLVEVTDGRVVLETTDGRREVEIGQIARGRVIF